MPPPDLVERLNRTTDIRERVSLADELVAQLSARWDAHPHSAMEHLESIVMSLPIRLSHVVVRRAVNEWKKKKTYSPEAGGSADHCYMSALILSENIDLADSAWAKRVLPSTLDKELNYSRFDRMRDGDKREQLVRALSKRISGE